MGKFLTNTLKGSFKSLEIFELGQLLPLKIWHVLFGLIGKRKNGVVLFCKEYFAS